MKMNFHITKRILLIPIFLLVGIVSAHADIEILEDSRIYPQRDPEPFTEGMQAFNYPSFNNFYPNPNLTEEAFGEDERYFLVGRWCEDGDCPGSSPIYFNTLLLLNDLKVGDKIKLAIYFHNNGNDPYDGGGWSSPDAENVTIGVETLNTVDPDYDDFTLIRPKGYIRANNNEYRTDKDDPATRLKDSGNIIRKATDDMQIVIPEGLELVPGNYWGLTNQEAGFNGSISGTTTLTIPTETGHVHINVTSHKDDNKMWLSFDKIPGCFRYSGFAYFEVKVVAKPEAACQTLDTIPSTSHHFTIGTDETIIATPIDTEGDTYDHKMDFTTTGGNKGQFKVSGGNWEWSLPDINPGTHVLFRPLVAGDNVVKINTQGTGGCNASFSIDPEPVIECQTLQVTPPSGSTFTIGEPDATIIATPKDTDGHTYNHNLTYSTTGNNKGQFKLASGGTWQYTPLTVPPGGTHVLFRPLVAGSNVVKIDTQGTSACNADFSIENAPVEPECKQLNVTQNPSGQIYAGDTVVFTTTATQTSPPGGTFPSYIEYRVLNSSGVLSSPPFGSGLVLTVPQNWPVTFTASISTDPNNALSIHAVDADPDQCKNYYKTYEEESVAICASLSVTPNSFLVTDPNEQLTVQGTDSDGNALPGTTMTVWNKTSTTSKIYLQALPWIDLATLHTPTPIAYKPWIDPASPTGSLDVTISPSDPMYSSACKGTINITETVITDYCTHIDVTPTSAVHGTPFTILLTNIDPDPNAYNGNFYFNSPYGTFKNTSGEQKTTFSKAEFLAGIAYQPTASPSPAPGTSYVIQITSDDSHCYASIPISVPTGPGGDHGCDDLTITVPEDSAANPWDALSGGDEQAFEIDVHTHGGLSKTDLDYTWKATHGTWDYDGDGYNGGENTLKNLNPLQTNTVTITGKHDGETCHDTITFSPQLIPVTNNPEIKKFVFDGYDKEDTLYLSGNGDLGTIVTYTGEYSPGSSKTVNIWEDEMSNGKIYSDISGWLEYKDLLITYGTDESQQTMYESSNFDKGKLPSGITIYEAEDNAEYKCPLLLKDICISTPSPETAFSNGNPVTFTFSEDFPESQKVYIYYQMENHSLLSVNKCKDIANADECGETINNTIKFTATPQYATVGWVGSGNDSAKVIVTCPFFLVRESGDALFHDEFYSGIDISKCSPVHNGPIVIRPKKDSKENLPATGTPTPDPGNHLINSSHDVCKLSNTVSDLLPVEYQNVFQYFSSSVCEMESSVGVKWKKPVIITTMSANVTRVARWEKNLSEKNKLRFIADLEGLKNLESGVFITDQPLTIEATSGSSYLIKGDKDKGIPAAQTYIIKNADLTINSNIEYEDNTALATTSSADPKDVPSAAFVVINGNIYIKNSVTKIDGILMAIAKPELAVAVAGVPTTIEEKGRICTSADPDCEPEYKLLNSTRNLLTINGSIIGDIANLFLNRIGSGNPMADEGSITIRYDERLLLNTPPGLNELIDINQLRVAH